MRISRAIPKKSTASQRHTRRGQPGECGDVVSFGMEKKLRPLRRSQGCSLLYHPAPGIKPGRTGILAAPVQDGARRPAARSFSETDPRESNGSADGIHPVPSRRTLPFR